MKYFRNHTSRLVSLILAVVGVTSSTTLPLDPSSQKVCAATRASLTSLTQGPTPRASANGKIAFVSVNFQGGEFLPDIYTMNPDGSDRQQLTFDGGDAEPAWSPDGTQIAFTRTERGSVYGGGYGSIFVMNADGSNQRQLTHSVLNVRNDHNPSWSPDGTKIAFSNNLFPGGGLYVMNADGSGQRMISGVFSFTKIAWSPDSTKLAVAHWGGINLINIDGTNESPITQSPITHGSEDQEPAWSGDGSRIAFVRWVDCDANDCYSPDIWVVGADGSNPTQLTNDKGSHNPAWSPDARKIVFSTGLFAGDICVMNSDGSDRTNITNTSHASFPSWQPLTLAPPEGNPLDDAHFFVRQQYRDFLSREPDPNGLAFWTGNITSCGRDDQCIEVKRINVSAAFFLSIEFQQTGFLVYRTYKAAYGNLPEALVPVHFNEFLPDTKEIGQGVIVNQPGWDQVLENNKQAFMSEFVQRDRFTSAFPATMSADQFVDALNQNAGNPLLQTERDSLVSDLSSGVKTRADALRAVAENQTFSDAEFNRAFVLMEYFGYLRRDPNSGPDRNFDGYNFWLNKLNAFNGNFIAAELVKAFITSIEYRQRFGP